MDKDIDHLHVLRKRHHGVMEKKSLMTGKYIRTLLFNVMTVHLGHEFILYDIERSNKRKQELWYIHEGTRK